MSTEHCTFVNPLCPDDLCVLEYGHPFWRRKRHITGTMYGSAHTSREEQIALLRDPAQTGWKVGYCAARGTPVDRLVELGSNAQRQLSGSPS